MSTPDAQILHIVSDQWVCPGCHRAYASKDVANRCLLNHQSRVVLPFTVSDKIRYICRESVVSWREEGVIVKVCPKPDGLGYEYLVEVEGGRGIRKNVSQSFAPSEYGWTVKKWQKEQGPWKVADALGAHCHTEPIAPPDLPTTVRAIDFSFGKTQLLGDMAKPILTACPKCGKPSRLATVGGDCLSCTMGWDDDGRTLRDRAIEFAHAHDLGNDFEAAQASGSFIAAFAEALVEFAKQEIDRSKAGAAA